MGVIGDNGGSVFSTTIKDTWTKPRGVISGVGGGDVWGRGKGGMETTVLEQ